jgi:glycosyltransferase involved in cell wall biosynthesis
MSLNILHIANSFGYTNVYDKLFSKLNTLVDSQVVFYPMRAKKIDKYNNKQKPYTIINPLIIKKYDRYFYHGKIRKLYFYLTQKHHSTINSTNLVHAHTLFTDGGVALKLKKNQNIPYIVSVRSTDVDYFMKYALHLRNYGLRILNNANKIVFITPSLKNNLLRHFSASHRASLEKKSIIIPNGINNAFFETPLTERTKANTELIKLLYIGSFIKRKNLHKVINFCDLNHNKYHLTIIGSGGNFSKRISSQIEDSPNLSYLGRINDTKKIIDCIDRSDIFIMPSENETFGLVYVEALSRGIPIVYSKNTGIDGFFPNKTVGIRVHPRKPDTWDKHLQYLINNYDRISLRCRTEASHFNWDSISNQVYNLYRSALAK